jgi:hypothetical protein
MTAMGARARLARGLMVCAVVMLPACRVADDTDLQPPPGFAPLPVQPIEKQAKRAERSEFGAGFHPPERDPEGRTWRWMGRRGEIRLPNGQLPRRLRISGWVPVALMKAPPTVRITIGDRLLETFAVADGELRREYRVSAPLSESGGWSRLVIETDTAVRVAGDPRDLGVAIERADWGPAER